MPFYPAAVVMSTRRPFPAWCVPVLPGGISRSRRACPYPSDMNGAEWAVRTAAADPGVAGRPRRPPGQLVHARIVDAIRYLTHNGPVWRAPPAFPARRHRLLGDG